MRVLITGGSSIIGAGIAQAIASEGYSSVIYDRLKPSKPLPRTDYISGDIRDISALRKAASDCDHGIHLAVVSEGANSEEFLSVNVAGAYNFLKIAEERRFKTCIVAGSAPVHMPHISLEQWPLFPTASDEDRLYDLTKILQEVITKEFHDHGLPALCLRFGHLVRGQEETNLKRTKPLEEVSYCRGGWVALEDVIQGCYQALKIDSSKSFEILNLIGASPAYESYNVKATEERLGFKLNFRFKMY